MKIRLIEEIKNGKSTYSLGDYKNNYSEFEKIVFSLNELKHEGLIEANFHQESTSGSRSVDLVFNIKLTDSGIEYFEIE